MFFSILCWCCYHLDTLSTCPLKPCIAISIKWYYTCWRGQNWSTTASPAVELSQQALSESCSCFGKLSQTDFVCKLIFLISFQTKFFLILFFKVILCLTCTCFKTSTKISMRLMTKIKMKINSFTYKKIVCHAQRYSETIRTMLPNSND